mmetsp:Transcript_22713/g.48209  ORF Transcript_22713/g.48209 Transcript_22713/m.48209 type:complete len:481 (+) Transcript_22713:126-1568(+)
MTAETSSCDEGDLTHIGSPDEVDNLLSKELLELSLTDRNAIDEEIHGVVTLAPKETPKLLEVSLRDLSSELDRIPDDSPLKAAYIESQRLPTTYVNGRDFRLRFLRCELFDAKKAALRMTKFLDIAKELVGPEVLQRPIRISDFTKEETKLLRKGNVQLLPYRDRSGRPIFVWVGDFGLEKGTGRTRTKICLYMFYSISDDIESQRKGITYLCWAGSNEIGGRLPKKADVDIISRMQLGIPLRTCSTHFCLPDKPYFHVIRTVFAMAHVVFRSRLKFHIGEEVELRYKLQSYGIPVELIPVTGTGNIKTVYFKQWLRLRKIMEETKGDEKYIATKFIECPRSSDVIFRTGTSLTCHKGNSMFQSTIESKIKEHSAASQKGKMAITKEIIAEVKQNDGRFLQWDTRGWWMEVKGASRIHAKVAVSVRDFKGKSVAQRKTRQTFESSTYLFQNQHSKRSKLSNENCCDSYGSATEDKCFPII